MVAAAMAVVGSVGQVSAESSNGGIGTAIAGKLCRLLLEGNGSGVFIASEIWAVSL